MNEGHCPFALDRMMSKLLPGFSLSSNHYASCGWCSSLRFWFCGLPGLPSGMEMMGAVKFTELARCIEEATLEWSASGLVGQRPKDSLPAPPPPALVAGTQQSDSSLGKAELTKSVALKEAELPLGRGTARLLALGKLSLPWNKVPVDAASWSKES